MKLNFHLTILATIALLTPICLTSVVNAEIEISQQEVIAQNIKFQTPEIREQGDRMNTAVNGGTRNRCAFKDGLTALIPETNIGLTLAEYPKFFVYLPALEVLKKDRCSDFLPEEIRVEFDLGDEADKSKSVYVTEFKLPNTKGIIRIDLPDDGSIPVLAVGQKYQWVVSIVIDPFDRSKDMYVYGWIKRIETFPTLLQQLKTTTLDNHPKVYAEAGIWHETLDSLATLRQSNPNNSTFLIQWQDILKSVGLETVADAPY
ncbi:hypothetical protein AFK68_20130 [Hydrocoleum sp. CS-953]|uniref:DUF928 domain-containing protein n=1 Tax=Hydrocoleum sp. CS-953 TaxID=1671698 RepID=UPI000B9C3E57|nr:DUF928 domain-containing protein [Hydrocoleum sp. CS-953]OZH53069.1 hypothetical protein AFK68_20130 [Hydrocoleum sp. CS-953]